jgi:uncharacterized membrane protein YkvA (DUF1232 family)
MISIHNYAIKLLSGTPKPKEGPRGYGWHSRASHYLRKAFVIYLIMKDPQSPFLAKAVAALSVGYIFSPIQLIPSFIPVFGWLDDVAVLSAGMWLLNRLTPKAVMLQCQANAMAMQAKWLSEAVARPEPRTWRFLQ